MKILFYIIFRRKIMETLSTQHIFTMTLRKNYTFKIHHSMTHILLHQWRKTSQISSWFLLWIIYSPKCTQDGNNTFKIQYTKDTSEGFQFYNTIYIHIMRIPSLQIHYTLTYPFLVPYIHGGY